MTDHQAEFELLRSEDMFVEIGVASDVMSMRRRLERTPLVCRIVRAVRENETLVHDLMSFVNRLLSESYDRKYRHPDDIAICAALVILTVVPLSKVYELLVRLSRVGDPSLCWVRRMAEHCLALLTQRLEGATEGDQRGLGGAVSNPLEDLYFSQKETDRICCHGTFDYPDKGTQEIRIPFKLSSAQESNLKALGQETDLSDLARGAHSQEIEHGE